MSPLTPGRRHPRALIPAAIAVLLSLLPGPGHAARLTVDSAAAYALKHNPALAAALAGLEEARARVLHAGSLPNPELETEYGPNIRGREFSAGILFSQRFPLTNRLKLEKGLSAAMVTLAETEIRQAERELAAEVKSLAVKWLALRDRRQAIARQTAAARELAAVLAKSAAAGEIPPLETAQLELEISQLSMLSLQAGGEATVLEGSLRPLLGAPATESVEITGSLTAPSPHSGHSAARPEAHPAYQAALVRAENARRSLGIVKASRWEDVTVGVGYGRSHTDDSGAGMEKENMAVIRFSLPLPLRRNNNASHIAEAEAAIRRSDLEAAAAAEKLRAGATAALGEMKSLAALHQEAAGTLLPQAQTLEDKLAALRRQGQASMADVLRARQQKLSLETAVLDARRDWHLARLRYEAATGR